MDRVTLSQTLPGSLPSLAAQRSPSTGRDTAGIQPAEDDSPNESGKDRVSLSSEARKLQELAARDREVRAHEQAHSAVGGRYAGSARFSYEQGPDGRRYAIGGEVPIDTGKIPGDPQATLQKATVVRAAALAPAQPSAQDQRIAAVAAQMAQEARIELQAERRAARQEQQTTERPTAAHGEDSSLPSETAGRPGGSRLSVHA